MRNVEVNEEDIFVNTAYKIYSQLNCTLTRLQYKDENFNLLQQTMFTHGSTHNNFQLHLREAFQVSRQSEIDRFFPYAKLDRKMLWHSAKPSELLYKLKYGLQGTFILY